MGETNFIFCPAIGVYQGMRNATCNVTNQKGELFNEGRLVLQICPGSLPLTVDV